MYNDLLLDRIVAVPVQDPDARIQELITEIEELDNLLSPEAQSLIRDLRPRTVTDDVYEDIEENATFGERMADLLTDLAGSIGFVYLNLLWFAMWIILNLEIIPGVEAFDPFPFGLLTMVVSLEAIFLSLFILISQNRQASKDRAVADNDYQVNLKNELEIVDMHRKVDIMTSAMEMQTRLVNALVAARRQELNATVRAMEHARREDML